MPNVKRRAVIVFATKVKNLGFRAKKYNFVHKFINLDVGGRDRFNQNIQAAKYDPYNPKCSGQFDPDPVRPTPRPQVSETGTKPAILGKTTKSSWDDSKKTPIPPYGACFSAEATVTTRRLGETRMDQLKLGDEVIMRFLVVFERIIEKKN